MSNFNNFNNNNNTERSSRPSTSTKGGHFTNSKQAVPCALDVSYYDDMIRIQFAPELPATKQTENRRYDYENCVMTALTRSKCNEIYNAYVEVIRPAIENCVDTSISVTLAGVNLLVIGTGVSDGIPHPYIAFYKDLDTQTLVAPQEKRLKYEFNTGEFILGYNPDTGEFKKRVVTYNEVDLFFNDMKNVRNASSNAYVHTERAVNRYTRDTLDSKINRIGEKLGLDLSTKNKYTRGGGGRGSIFDAAMNTMSEQTTTNATIASIDDIDALMAEQF